jgi:antitoxin component of MazEF toxin-antitoxin module
MPLASPGFGRAAKDRDVGGSVECNYNNYMRSMELKVTRIGNSRGVRLPAATLERYGIHETVLMEERSDGILLRPHGAASVKLSWEETARQMANSGEDWSEWEIATADGADSAPWIATRSTRVSEKDVPRKPRRPKS